jgi:hypothetical protein
MAEKGETLSDSALTPPTPPQLYQTTQTYQDRIRIAALESEDVTHLLGKLGEEPLV